MRGLKIILTMSSFVFLITVGVLVAVSAGQPPVRNHGLASAPAGRGLPFATRGSGQRDQELSLLLALKVFGDGRVARVTRSAAKDSADRAASGKARSQPSS